MIKRAMVMVAVLGMMGMNAVAEEPAAKKNCAGTYRCKRLEQFRARCAEMREQRQKIVGALIPHKDALMAAGLAAREAKIALVDVILEQGSNEQAVRAAWREFAKQTEDSVVAVSAAASDALAQLTPEQRKQLNEGRKQLQTMGDALLDKLQAAVNADGGVIAKMHANATPEDKEAMGQLLGTAMQTAARIQAQMTPEQRAQAAAFISELMSAAGAATQ